MPIVETNMGQGPHRWIGTPRHVGKTPHYFAERGCLVDYRGEIIEIDQTAEFGFNITLLTATHDPDWLIDGRTGYSFRPLIIGPKVWVCSNAVLYNCTIGEGAVIGLGAVVRSMNVKPYSMVVGNPAVVIARYINGTWRKRKRT